MVRTHHPPDRVRLAPADWGGLCSLALAILTLLSATLYKVHEFSVLTSERMAVAEQQIEAAGSDRKRIWDKVEQIDDRSRDRGR